MFLRQRGFKNRPIISGLSLSFPLAFAHNAIFNRFLFFFLSFKRIVANVVSGSRLELKKIN
jgi:hypothetical protein